MKCSGKVGEYAGGECGQYCQEMKQKIKKGRIVDSKQCRGRVFVQYVRLDTTRNWIEWPEWSSV